MQKQPNILFAIADDASHFSAYGHTFVHTPHFDGVCKNGIRFDAAFTTNPKCAPSRASILTGRHTWQNRESCLHWNYWPENLPVYPDMLEKVGYHIGFTGKPWGPGEWTRCGRTRNPAGPEYNDHTLEPPPGSNINRRDYAANFRSFLESRPEDSPFYFWYGGHEPHRSYTYGEGEANGKTKDSISSVPPYWPDEESTRTDMLDYAFEIEWFDTHLGKMLAEIDQIGELHNTLVVVTSDNGCPFPRVKGQMYEDDYKLPLAVMWGDKVGKGRIVQDLVSFVDFAPTFLEAAGVHTPEYMVGKSLFDVFAATGSGTVTPDRTRAYMGRERHDMGREGDLGYPARCIRTPRYLYVRNFAPDRWPAGNPETNYTGCDSSPVKKRIIELEKEGCMYHWQLAFGKRPLEELYDIQQDPHCLTNLAGLHAFQQIREGLWQELQQVLTETGDPRILGNGAIFDTYEYYVDAPHSWEHYLKGDWKGQGY